MIAAPGFTAQAKSAARAAGVPIPRVAEYPGAFSAHTREQLLENTRAVLCPQIEKALTVPLSEKEREQGDAAGGKDGIVFVGTAAQVNAYFAQNGWTDGLPIMPPTQEAIAEFLEFCDLPADATVAVVPPARREVTARQVAANGVMAGCPPEYMPILVAIAKAMTNGNFRRTLASTHAWTPYCWVNGPIARQLGIDHGQGEISGRGNAAIGRFFNLAMLNFGGYYIKENRMGTFGYLMPWCLAEDEETALQARVAPLPHAARLPPQRERPDGCLRPVLGQQHGSRNNRCPQDHGADGLGCRRKTTVRHRQRHAIRLPHHACHRSRSAEPVAAIQKQRNAGKRLG